MLSRRRFLAQSATLACAQPLASLTGGFREAAKPVMIDAHVHVWKHDPAYPFAPDAKVPPFDATPETLLALMRANGVARTVLIQVIHYKWDNRYLARVLQQYPQYFRGVCRVDPQDPAAPDHLTRLTEEGFRGVRLSPAATPDGNWIRGPRMPPLWRRCAELKVPMTILAPVTRLPDLAPLIEANPELDVVIDHMADCPLHRPELLQKLLDLARYPRVYVKISDLWVVSRQAYPYADAQEQLRQVHAAFGAQRLMWDTNWPVSLAQLPYARIVELYRDRLEFFSVKEREEVLYKTAQRVWPFGL